MNIQNLQFFDKFGKNLNLDFNLDGNFWEGTIYFPELSVYLFDNENIFILEKTGQNFKFPTLSSTQSILFNWKNNAIPEFFLYDVERDNELKNFFINLFPKVINPFMTKFFMSLNLVLVFGSKVSLS